MKVDHNTHSTTLDHHQGHRQGEHETQPTETWHKTQQLNPTITMIPTWTSLTLTKATAKDEAMEKH